MKEMKMTRGYKVFNSDWTCRGFQYKVGETYEEDVTPKVCNRGFHYCEKAADCFGYYSFNPENKVAEVLAIGDVDTDGKKSCTNKIQIVREIPWTELLELVNTGEGCTGLCNTGSYNSGNRNSGDWNTGDWNNCNFSNGCFNTVTPEIYMFNKPSEWTYIDWLESEARRLLNQMPGDVLKYVVFPNMTDEEKEAHPEAETTGGYLKFSDDSERRSIWWRELLDEEKAIIKALPNFDPGIFKEITGVDVTEE